MVQKLENEKIGTERGKLFSSPKIRLSVLKRNRKSASDPSRFEGQGVFYKGKLIGERDVAAAKGLEMCAEAMRSVKAAAQATRTHKTRIQLQINTEGIKILDERSNAVLHNFPVSGLSFVARDTTDPRAFGLVFGDAQHKYRFYGIKTAQTSDQAVLAIRNMLQIVFERKAKQLLDNQMEPFESKASVADLLDLDTELSMIEQGVAVTDLLDLETEFASIEQGGAQQLQQIPPMDVFGAMSFTDPFADSFVSSNASIATNTTATNSSTPISQWNQQALCQNQMPITHSQPAINTFSETNPFVSPFSPVSDPFSTISAQSTKPTIDWGVNENIAPRMNHESTLAYFETNGQKSNIWEDNFKRDTSLEDVFCKLSNIDLTMNSPTISQSIPCCRAMYTYQSNNSEDLEFQEGSIIELISQIDENWFKGRLNGRKGLFPINFVEVIIPLNY